VRANQTATGVNQTGDGDESQGEERRPDVLAHRKILRTEKVRLPRGSDALARAFDRFCIISKAVPASIRAYLRNSRSKAAKL
jgi:hypothetical protein